MFTMQQEVKNQNNKAMYCNILQSLLPKHVLKNMQSSRAFFISLFLLRQDSKDKAYKE